jgi:hypothetical protein
MAYEKLIPTIKCSLNSTKKNSPVKAGAVLLKPLRGKLQ